MIKTLLAMLAFLILAPSAARAEDGYRLWLRYDPVEAPARQAYSARATAIVAPGTSPTATAARDELQRGLTGLLARPIPIASSGRDGVILLATPRSSAAVAALDLPLAPLGEEGYLIRSIRLGGRPATLIAAN